MKYREKILESGEKIFLGKDEDSNDELMLEYEKTPHIIMHTVNPGSPFCVILAKKPTKKEIYEAACYCASYSQDWRDNKGDVAVNVFTGKDISKEKEMKPGTWKVKKSKIVKAKKEDISEIKQKDR